MVHAHAVAQELSQYLLLFHILMLSEPKGKIADYDNQKGAFKNMCKGGVKTLVCHEIM